MPKIAAHSKIFRDWEGLLGASAKNLELIPGLEEYKAELEGFLAQGKETKVQQEAFAVQRTVMTQRLVDIETAGAESARKLRAYVFSRLGSRTEILKHFGLVPRLRQNRKAQATKRRNAAAVPAPDPGAEPSHNEQTEKGESA
jgi:hypothetical protein